jgi:hypothetical protein
MISSLFFILLVYLSYKLCLAWDGETLKVHDDYNPSINARSLNENLSVNNCDNGCKTCINNTCTDCDLGFKLNNDKTCIKCDIQKLYEEKCIGDICKLDTGDVNGGEECNLCYNIDRNCKVCNLKSKKCLSCREEFFMYPHNDKCFPCQAGCKKCLDDGYCLKCLNDSYQLIDWNCYKHIACDNNCKNCNETTGVCNQCNDYFYLNDHNLCAKCPLNCLKCNQTSCIECDGDMFLGECIKCPVRYFDNKFNGTCSFCSDKFEFCYSCDFDKCHNCDSFRELDNNQCVCISGYYKLFLFNDCKPFIALLLASSFIFLIMFFLIYLIIFIVYSVVPFKIWLEKISIYLVNLWRGTNEIFKIYK